MTQTKQPRNPRHRNPMTESCYDFRIPHDKEYSSAVGFSLRRRTQYEVLDNGYSTRHVHMIDNTPYTVCSVFDRSEKKTPEDMIRRLIDLDYGKVSAR